MMICLSDYTLKTVFSNRLTNKDRKDIEIFSEEAFKEKKHESYLNMDVYKWEEKPHTLMYKLLAENLFHSETGGLELIYHKGKLVALSGYYKSKFDQNCWIGGVRSWVNKEHRFNYLLGRYLIPAQFANCLVKGAKCFMLTFNEYTRYLPQFVKRVKCSGKGKMFSVAKDFPDFYTMMEYYPKRLKIQNVYQHALVLLIDKTYTLNFSEIEE